MFPNYQRLEAGGLGIAKRLKNDTVEGFFVWGIIKDTWPVWQTRMHCK